MRFYFYSNWSPREVTDWPSIYDLTRLTHFCYSCVISGSSIMTMYVTHSIFEQPPASIPIIDCSDKCFCPGLLRRKYSENEYMKLWLSHTARAAVESDMLAYTTSSGDMFIWATNWDNPETLYLLQSFSQHESNPLVARCMWFCLKANNKMKGKYWGNTIKFNSSWSAALLETNYVIWIWIIPTVPFLQHIQIHCIQYEASQNMHAHFKIYFWRQQQFQPEARLAVRVMKLWWQVVLWRLHCVYKCHLKALSATCFLPHLPTMKLHRALNTPRAASTTDKSICKR